MSIQCETILKILSYSKIYVNFNGFYVVVLQKEDMIYVTNNFGQRINCIIRIRLSMREKEFLARLIRKLIYSTYIRRSLFNFEFYFGY